MDQSIYMQRLSNTTYKNLSTLNVSDLVSEVISQAKSEVSPKVYPPGTWLCPPVNMIPLKYQKNKFYFQLRIEDLGESESQANFNK